MTEPSMTGTPGLSDAELIARVRAGDSDAYGELFDRHQEAAHRLATKLVRGNDTDDLVSEAFAKVFVLLQSGAGPDVAFRAYLLTAVRRLHVDRVRAAQRLQVTDEIETFDPGVPFQDTAVEGFERRTSARAFASLPERWQLVLWHLDVEGQKPSDIAPLLGLSANSVSALAYRAREGLRQSYLQMHLATAENIRCRWATERMGAYVRNGLANREARQLREHLDGCRRCTGVYLELVEVNSDLRGLLAPLLLGGLAAGYLAGTSASGGSGALAAWGLVTRAGEVIKAAGNTAVTAGAAGSVAVMVTTLALVVGSNTPQQTTADGSLGPGAGFPGPGLVEDLAPPLPKPEAVPQPPSAPRPSSPVPTEPAEPDPPSPEPPTDLTGPPEPPPPTTLRVTVLDDESSQSAGDGPGHHQAGGPNDASGGGPVNSSGGGAGGGGVSTTTGNDAPPAPQPDPNPKPAPDPNPKPDPPNPKPDPPDSEPPTSEPPTSEPPSSEPPSSEPPTTEPPTTEPPTTEPPTTEPPEEPSPSDEPSSLVDRTLRHLRDHTPVRADRSGTRTSGVAAPLSGAQQSAEQQSAAHQSSGGEIEDSEALPADAVEGAADAAKGAADAAKDEVDAAVSGATDPAAGSSTDAGSSGSTTAVGNTDFAVDIVIAEQQTDDPWARAWLQVTSPEPVLTDVTVASEMELAAIMMLARSDPGIGSWCWGNQSAESCDIGFESCDFVPWTLTCSDRRTIRAGEYGVELGPVPLFRSVPARAELEVVQGPAAAAPTGSNDVCHWPSDPDRDCIGVRQASAGASEAGPPDTGQVEAGPSGSAPSDTTPDPAQPAPTEPAPSLPAPVEPGSLEPAPSAVG